MLENRPCVQAVRKPQCSLPAQALSATQKKRVPIKGSPTRFSGHAPAFCLPGGALGSECAAKGYTRWAVLRLPGFSATRDIAILVALRIRMKWYQRLAWLCGEERSLVYVR